MRMFQKLDVVNSVEMRLCKTALIKHGCTECFRACSIGLTHYCRHSWWSSLAAITSVDICLGLLSTSSKTVMTRCCSSHEWMTAVSAVGIY